MNLRIRNLVRLSFTKNTLHSIIDYNKEYAPTFAYLTDEIDKLMTIFSCNNLNSNKSKGRSIKEALYADAVCDHVRNDMKPLMSDSNNSNVHGDIFLVCIAVVLLDDIYNDCSNKLKKLVGHVISQVAKLEVELDKQAKHDDVRDEAIRFVNNIYETMETY